MPAALKGSKTPLSHPVYTVHVELPADLRHLVDIAAVLLAGDGRVRSDDDLVFFNNPSRAGVTLRPDGTLQVDLSQVPSKVERVLVTGSTEAQGKTFGDIPAMTIRVDGPRQRIQFTPPGLSVESVLQMVVFYRRDGAWKLDAIGQGYSEGLAAFATAHGIEVDDPGHPEPIIPATPIPPGPSPIDMTKVRIVLDKSSPTKTAQIDLRKSRGETGWVLTVGLEWDGRGARYGPAGQVTRYGEGDLDVYFFCRNEQTDDFVIISGEPGHRGSLGSWPFIEHGGDSTSLARTASRPSNRCTSAPTRTAISWSTSTRASTTAPGRSTPSVDPAWRSATAAQGVMDSPALTRTRSSSVPGTAGNSYWATVAHIDVQDGILTVDGQTRYSRTGSKHMPGLTRTGKYLREPDGGPVGRSKSRDGQGLDRYSGKCPTK